MVLEITAQGLVVFSFTVAMLVTFSIMDIKIRKVTNETIIVGLNMGVLLGAFTGHLLDNLFLHLIALIIGIPLAIVLFYGKAIGGADAKTIGLLACISPGFEFGQFVDMMFEAVLGVLVPVLVMFVMGVIYSKKKNPTDSKQTPLIPFLLVGYLLMQLIVLL